MSPADTWKGLFNATSDPEQKALQEEVKKPALFEPSQADAHKEILRLLKENEPDTIIIVAIGPLTNLAIAAAEDPETFLRVKEVVSMGGNVYETGNVKPPPYADAAAASIPEPPFRLLKQAPGSIRGALTAEKPDHTSRRVQCVRRLCSSGKSVRTFLAQPTHYDAAHTSSAARHTA